MTRKRFDTAPQFNVDEEGLVIQQVAGSTVPLLQIKDHTGSSLMTVNSTGQMSSAAPSTFDTLTVNTSATLPATTSIGTITSTELSYLDGVTSAVQTQIDAKAPLASPALTGTPTAPTAAAATNTTQIATTAFVRTEISNLVASSPATLDTLDELAAALGDDPNFATTVTNSIATKAPLASPDLTGVPTAPTAAVGTNTTQIATTAYVLSAIPAGTVQDYVGDSEPSGWKFLNGQTLTGAQTSFPQLWAAAPAAWRSGSNLVLPDARGRVSVAKSATGTFSGVVGSTGGAETVTLTANQSGVKSHGHSFTGTQGTVVAETQDHTHGGSTQNDTPDHSHVVPIGVAQEGVFTGIIGTSGHNGNVHTWAASATSNGANTRHTHPFTTGGRSATHNHTFTPAGTVSTHAGESAGEAHTNLQPYIVLNKIIKVH